MKSVKSFSIPAYYTPGNQPPTAEGWYFGQSIQGKLTYLYWKDGSFWCNGQRIEVNYYAELPQFISAILDSLRA
jgi:hypothetical protein